MNNSEKFSEIINFTEKLIDQDLPDDDKLKKIADKVRNTLNYYNWVGFYKVRGEDHLILGVFSGEPTEHTDIKFGQGICGQVAEKLEPLIIDNVQTENNYLSCSPRVKSEIVVPVYKQGDFIAEIDVDSHFEKAFSREDQQFLEKLAEKIHQLF
ncbi:MAG: GAF domain-containing protein [bacterium]